MDYISREDAWNILNVSTRTIDRYAKKNKLWYKKISNKVMILKSDVLNLLDEMSVTSKQINTEVISEKININEDIDKNIEQSNILNTNDYKNMWNILLIFQEQQKIIEKKDLTILDMQKYIWELEYKIDNTINKSEHNEEIQRLFYEKREVEKDTTNLSNKLKKEKLKNMILVWFFFIIILSIIFVVFLSKN